MALLLFNPPVGAALNRGAAINAGIIGCWLFNEGGGEIFKDIAGVNNGSGGGNPVSTSGGYGNALLFNGTTQNVSMPASANLRPANFTISALVRSTHSNGATYERIVDQNYSNGWVLCLEGGTGKAMIASTPTLLASSTVIANDGLWHLVTGTYSTGLFSIYVDGKLENTASATAASYASNNVTVGSNGAGGELFQGGISNVRIYNRAISAGEIRQLYAQPFAGIAFPKIRGFNSVTASATIFRRTMMRRSGSRGVPA